MNQTTTITLTEKEVEDLLTLLSIDMDAVGCNHVMQRRLSSIKRKLQESRK